MPSTPKPTSAAAGTCKPVASADEASPTTESNAWAGFKSGGRLEAYKWDTSSNEDLEAANDNAAEDLCTDCIYIYIYINK